MTTHPCSTIFVDTTDCYAASAAAAMMMSRLLRRLSIALSALTTILVSIAIHFAVRLPHMSKEPSSVTSFLLETPLHHQPTHSQQHNDPSLHSSKDSVASCLLIMDDNHWLVEWLAYHWTTINLRYMIVAIDGRSQTSPIDILDRWQGRIQFELWNDTHFFRKVPRYKNLQEINLARQQAFLAKCLRTLYKRKNNNNVSWVMTTDTDEFVVINPRTKRPKHELFRSHVPSIEQPGSTLSFLNAEQERNGTRCLSMGRLQFSPDESPLEQVHRHVPTVFNASDFLTLRWLIGAGDLVGPKNIVDLSALEPNQIPRDTAYQHRVIPDVCPEAGHTWTRKNSLLQVYHYFGTYEQFTFRQDARLYVKGAGRNTRYERFRGQNVGHYDELRPWLSTFVRLVGNAEAKRLLDGVGQIQGWRGPQAQETRFAP